MLRSYEGDVFIGEGPCEDMRRREGVECEVEVVSTTNLFSKINF